MMDRLVLFDIDGTLLSTNGSAARAFRRALVEVFGTSGPRTGYSFAGRTDPQIARDLLTFAGFTRDQIEANLPSMWPIYEANLAAELRGTAAEPFPGAHELLDRLQPVRRSVLGLLTGNIVPGARLKLDSSGIGFDRFRVGAFGSDHADRRELPEVAIERAADAVGHRFSGKDVVIVGDTPHDIACGEHLGVRTIAVATGSFTLEQLEECGPDHVFPDLTDTERVLSAILD